MTKARSLSDFIESDGSVTLVDNQKIKVGTGNDLEIYHDGSHSFIYDGGVGDLKLQATNLLLEATDGTNYIHCADDGAVRLYYNGLTKLTTTSTGVDVTGTITASGLVYPSSDGTNGQVLTTDGSGNLSFSTISGYTDSDVETYLDGGTATPVFSNTEISGTIKLDGNYPTGTENVALGNGALSNLTTGVRNTAIGEIAGQSITEAGEATLVGRQAGANLTTGNSNTFIGGRAGLTATTGTENTAVGQASLYSMTTGSSNTAIGRGALLSNTTASNNTAVGRNSLNANTTGADNTAVGRNALDANTTGVNNVAIGESALSAATTASGNTAIGKDALAIATGGENTVVGKKAGDAIQAHVRNTIMGDTAGSAVNSSDNTFIGQNSGSAITSGDANTILGRYSGNEGGLDIRTSSNNIVLSDGDGNPQFFITPDGKTNINSVDTTPRGILNVQGTVSSAVTTLLSFGDMGQRGAGTAQAIDFVMGRTGFISEDACASFRGVCEGASSTTISHQIGFEFYTGVGSTQHRILRLRATGSMMQLNSDEVPTYGNPYVAGAFVMGPTQAGGNINGGLTNSIALVNRGGELYATDSSLNSTQLTPHNWALIDDGPSEELAWTYWSQRPSPENKDIMQGINVDMAKVVRGVEDLIGEKLIYTENSNMDDHTHQSIIADIQSTLADLTTRIEALEG